MFRKLYWVTEALQFNGTSQVLGVYTSIPDLLSRGLAGMEKINFRLRISLVKLDSTEPPLGVWMAGTCPELANDLRQYSATGEFALEHCEQLAHALSGFSTVTQ